MLCTLGLSNCIIRVSCSKLHEVQRMRFALSKPPVHNAHTAAEHSSSYAQSICTTKWTNPTLLLPAYRIFRSVAQIEVYSQAWVTTDPRWSRPWSSPPFFATAALEASTLCHSLTHWTQAVFFFFQRPLSPLVTGVGTSQAADDSLVRSRTDSRLWNMDTVAHIAPSYKSSRLGCWKISTRRFQTRVSTSKYCCVICLLPGSPFCTGTYEIQPD